MRSASNVTAIIETIAAALVRAVVIDSATSGILLPSCNQAPSTSGTTLKTGTFTGTRTASNWPKTVVALSRSTKAAALAATPGSVGRTIAPTLDFRIDCG